MLLPLTERCFCGPQDDVYLHCDGAHGWEGTMKPEIKAAAEAKGCAGAMQAMPAIFVAAAAVICHLCAIHSAAQPTLTPRCSRRR